MTTLLTARTPEDLLAAVPVVLGFRPSQSLVMLTFGGRHCFGARVDLPEVRAPAAVLDELAETLLAPALEHGVDRVAFVVYTAEAPLAARLGARLVGSFPPAGVDVIDVLRADRGGWTSVPCRDGAREEPLRPYDDRTHPFSAQAVFDGRVTHGSRDELRRALSADPELGRRTRQAHLALPRPGPDEHATVLGLLERCVGEGRPPDDEEAARVLRVVTAVEVRDAALFAVTGDQSVAHLDLWSSLLRRASGAQVPDTAAVTAFCAWQAGHGALAWCALDRCFEVEPGHTLGLALAECLVRAVPPSAWQEVADRPDAESGTA